ncbi:ABC transporter permease [Paenibacillus sp. FSL R5-0623]|uniref:ABC transporter permease n=1 Tax=Paenibacillus amylolyticus TaxID=1451 RepID=A0ABD8AU30_PAEAM|nr:MULTISPECIES: ABC transporter permease [Paenibacillus]ETT33573.1 permease [Paenibacillus sp. FSL R5-192]MBY0118677.1 ABC transporter permease [Paenibacillus xylanexedens]OME95511.1 permease [Paenibacillus amylolyticus]OMF00527.1 permease [Paenibacillus amylolyticus]OMF60428.1 permease [Paenibacillus sp. FSL R5-0765]
MTGRALSSDWLKIRGKGIWFLVFLAPLGLTAMQALNFGLRLDYLKEQYADNLWGGLLGNVVVFVPLSLMLGATILSSMIANVEHEQGSWKQLLAMPIPRPAVYLAKFLLACVLLVISCLLLTAGIVGLGLILGFHASEIPWTHAIKLGLLPLAGALPVLSLELWLTMVNKNQALPVTLGIVLAITGMFSLSISPIFPLAWAQMAWNGPNPYLYAGMGAGLGLLILLLGMMHFSRKDVA